MQSTIYLSLHLIGILQAGKLRWQLTMPLREATADFLPHSIRFSHISSIFSVYPEITFFMPLPQISGSSSTLIKCLAPPLNKDHRKNSSIIADLTQVLAYCGLCAPSGSIVRGLHRDNRHGSLRVLLRVGLHNLPWLLHPGDGAIQKVTVILHGKEKKERAIIKPYIQ